MQVISVAFKLTIHEIWGMEIELLGMPRREVWWNFSGQLTGFSQASFALLS
jgi:hypothetical protein